MLNLSIRIDCSHALISKREGSLLGLKGRSSENPALPPIESRRNTF